MAQLHHIKEFLDIFGPIFIHFLAEKICVLSKELESGGVCLALHKD